VLVPVEFVNAPPVAPVPGVAEAPVLEAGTPAGAAPPPLPMAKDWILANDKIKIAEPVIDFMFLLLLFGALRYRAISVPKHPASEWGHGSSADEIRPLKVHIQDILRFQHEINKTSARHPNCFQPI
jgi:hypothetical protein